MCGGGIGWKWLRMRGWAGWRGVFEKVLHLRKPDSVPRWRTSGSTVIPLKAALRRPTPVVSRVRRTREISAVAGGPGRRPVLPCLSCTARGLSCPRPYGAGRWALTPPFHPYLCLLRGGGGIFSATLSVSGGLRRPLPAFFMRRAAIWCPDFPPAGLATCRRPSRVQRWEDGVGKGRKRAVISGGIIRRVGERLGRRRASGGSGRGVCCFRPVWRRIWLSGLG